MNVQAVDPTETPVAEWDFREGTFGAPEVAAIAAQHINEDTAYIVEAPWDLWIFDNTTLKWIQGPQPLELICRGPLYDGSSGIIEGNFSVDLGFEHLFTGHDIRLSLTSDERVEFHCPTLNCDGQWEDWEYPNLHL